MTEAYPLSWPPGEPRAAVRKAAPFQPRSFGLARDQLIREVELLGGAEIVLSTNIPLRQDGLPYSDFERRKITDPGVALYFTWRKKRHAMACDLWTRIEDNLRALSLSIEAMRGLERWGASRILERAFTGFALLPAPPQWFDVLGVSPATSEKEIKDAYRRLARERHADNGGSDYQMSELNRALEAAYEQMGRGR